MSQTLWTVAAVGLLAHGTAAGQVENWQLGGGSGPAWSDFTQLNVLVDDFSEPATLRPRELDPDVNLLPLLENWQNFRYPRNPLYQDGQPRIWRGLKTDNSNRFSVEPTKFIDGDPNTAIVKQNWGPGGCKVHDEFYTIDVGARIPFERFVYYPPDGFNTVTDEPFRPNFTVNKFELTATNDMEALEAEEPTRGPIPGGTPLYNDYCNTIFFNTRNTLCHYVPLDVMLHSTAQNFEGVVDLAFPQQYLRVFRFRPMPDESTGCGIIYRLAYAELEIYGRGFVPEATWESRVVDLGREFNFGKVTFGITPMRRTQDSEGGLAEDPDASVGAQVEVRTGRDESPIAYMTYNTRGGTEETSLDDYTGLRDVCSANHHDTCNRIKTEGWRGPIARDTENWSFWSSPVRESGFHPRLPNGRYFQIRIKLESDGLWEFARMDSLAIEISPLLAEVVRGEIAAATDLRPVGNLTRVEAGDPTDFIYDIAADFGAGSPGFDAVRLLADDAEFSSLQMGEPLADVTPDEVIPEPTGFVVLLPRRVEASEPPLRIGFKSTLYGASGTFAGEVFRRDSADLPQAIEAGDVSEEIGTNRLQVVAVPTSLGSVLSQVSVQPAIFSPQGDGVNDQTSIDYSLMRVAEVEVEVAVYDLGGRVLWQRMDVNSAGSHRVWWDGRDTQGQLVPPGIYLVQVRAASSKGDFERLQRVAVAY